MKMWTVKKMTYRLYQSVMKIAVRLIKYPEQRIINSAGAIKTIPDILKEQKIERICLFCSKTVRRHGLLDELLKDLEKAQIAYVIFEDIHPNTTVQNIEDGYEVYRENQCQGIVAIGGGSVLDCAKIVGIKVSNPNMSYNKMKKLTTQKKTNPCTIAVPTTAGTGSESTVAGVVTDMNKKEKYAIISFPSLPQFVILDPNLTLALPQSVTAYTGMDAFTHAIEAYIGNFGTSYTNAEALKAMQLIFENINKAYEDGSQVDVRNQMLIASNCAAKAFTRVYVGYVHAISHALSALYDVGHGKTNAIVLPYVLKYYGDTITQKLASIAVYTGIGTDREDAKVLAQRVIQRIEFMNKAMNIPDKVEELQEKDVDIIVTKALKEANPAYPVPKIMDEKDCTAIVRQLLID